MQVMVNGEPCEVAPSSSLADLLRKMNLVGQRFAVEVNQEVVPRSRHDELPLQTGDRVEIVQAIGGG